MARAAFSVRSGEETLQVQMVCLDDLVPLDDDLRRIERLVDWDHVRRTAEPFYRPGGAGRPGMDPAVLVKLALVLAWRGLPSMRQTLRVAATDVSIRRFLGFGLTERLPDHSTFSHAQTKRFADSSVFEQLFTAVLRQCTQAGLVGGRRLLIDATHIEADAALKSLRAELTLVESESESESESGDGATVVDEPAPRPALTLAEPRTGPTPKRSASNATAVSRTDPDGKLRHKPGQRTHLVHRGQVAVDPKRRVIIAVEAERATGSEADALERLVRRARFAGHRAGEVVADAGYASQDAYTTLDALNSTALIPPQPGAQHAAAEAARARMRTATGRDAAFDRQTHAEGAIAELKRHGASRARCRGTRLLQLQLLAAATAINLKRLLGHQDALPDSNTGDRTARLRTIRWLTDLLARCLDEIDRHAAANSSTGS
jgi:transposase